MEIGRSLNVAAALGNSAAQPFVTSVLGGIVRTTPFLLGFLILGAASAVAGQDLPEVGPVETEPATAEPEADSAPAQPDQALGVGHYTLELPEGASIEVDGGDPVFAPDGQLRLVEGVRRLIVRAPGRAEVERQVTVRGGERGHLRFVLAPLQRAESLGDPGERASAEAASERADLATTGLVLVGAGGALLIGGAAFFGLMSSEQGTMDANCDATTCPATFDQRSVVDRFELFRGFAWPLTFVGAGAAIAGSALIIHEITQTNPFAQDAPPPQVACSAVGCSVSWRARW